MRLTFAFSVLILMAVLVAALVNRFAGHIAGLIALALGLLMIALNWYLILNAEYYGGEE